MFEKKLEKKYFFYRKSSFECSRNSQMAAWNVGVTTVKYTRQSISNINGIKFYSVLRAKQD